MRPRLTESGKRVEGCEVCPHDKAWEGGRRLCNAYPFNKKKPNAGKIIDTDADKWCKLDIAPKQE